jgi:hypothetical protein
MGDGFCGLFVGYTAIAFIWRGWVKPRISHDRWFVAKIQTRNVANIWGAFTVSSRIVLWVQVLVGWLVGCFFMKHCQLHRSYI